MPSNKFTAQTPLSGSSIKFVPCERAYMAPANTVYADPSAKSNGTDPGAPWVDLGIVKDSKVSLVYTKTVKDVSTGIEKVRRGSYTTDKKCTASFTLEQYDLPVIESLSGLSGEAVGSIGAKIQLGQDDLVERSLLFIGTNKVDGKEVQHYSKKASINWSVAEDSDARALKVDCDFYSFLAAGETVESYVTMFILN